MSKVLNRAKYMPNLPSVIFLWATQQNLENTIIMKAVL